VPSFANFAVRSRGYSRTRSPDSVGGPDRSWDRRCLSPCIDDDVEFSRTDNQVETIAVDIEERLMTLIARILGGHGPGTIAPRHAGEVERLSGCGRNPPF
jgi:hypothetical protein